ncbi:L-seryl-tRNA(Sec) selenium transferase [Desulfatibacillum alkenivorans DSM 16219]|jgi:L-seryl-tRNA(Ser) seleniumtransferase|uniref:L-seryl-tRNA(Sec) selenium transferase n=1 Tax=Desulfatibacillum alkenivorans DSM 16219 TaxID=1121393 RepID=A0A1M6KI55_9BACT|nr:L-seryl-tRNA(Sec) selenium transferase [Desulfatibacillum alkenivorans]SHJ58628.1 L-seryl-tRNA(Sec) selenium transferase [Desulfatibacillum alkenivorans DSM 16219]
MAINQLKSLPKVDRILDSLMAESGGPPRSVLLKAARTAIEDARRSLVAGEAPSWIGDSLEHSVLERARALAALDMRDNLRRVINGTGVVVHTNLGRSLLPSVVCDHIVNAAGRYSNLEFDLEAGKRGSRFSIVEDLLCELTGAEAAMVVNNNAGAVFLSLMALAKGHEVVVSRGELVEIGGSFRIPDVMASSGAILREVGTTNRTHMRDYESAIGEETAMLLKAHTSNFAVVGFTASVSLEEIVDLGKKHDLIVMEDLGSGSLVDLSQYGLAKEPTVMESVAAGADVVTFSGDKMLGGPQAGIIVGKAESVNKIKKHPVARALRIDKLTLAALETTLRLYRDPIKRMEAVPTLRMLTMDPEVIKRKARRLQARIKKLGMDNLSAKVKAIDSKVGGGALPLQNLPSFGVAIYIEGRTANSVEKAMRELELPMVGRIEDDVFTLDMRTIADDEIPLAAHAAELVAGRS